MMREVNAALVENKKAIPQKWNGFLGKKYN